MERPLDPDFECARDAANAAGLSPRDFAVFWRIYERELLVKRSGELYEMTRMLAEERTEHLRELDRMKRRPIAPLVTMVLGAVFGCICMFVLLKF